MKTLTATEASRSFSHVLDEVEHGETIIVTRAGQRVAEIRPAVRGNGARFLQFLRNNPPDEEWAADIEGALGEDGIQPAWLDD